MIVRQFLQWVRARAYLYSDLSADDLAAAGAARVNSDAAGSNSTTRYDRRYAGLRAGRGEAATAASGTAVVSVDVWRKT